MRTLLRQIKRELKTAKHCAVYAEELSHVWPDGNQRDQKSRDLRRTMAFAFAFIVTAYARFSTRSRSRVMKDSLSG